MSAAVMPMRSTFSCAPATVARHVPTARLPSIVANAERFIGFSRRCRSRRSSARHATDMPVGPKLIPFARLGKGAGSGTAAEQRHGDCRLLVQRSNRGLAPRPSRAMDSLTAHRLARRLNDGRHGCREWQRTNARWDMAGRTGKLTRRQALHGGATLAIVAAAKAAFPSGAFAQGAGPETKAAKLGFIALTDAAPLFVAKEKGLFAKHGMPDVEVLKQASWGTTRDNLVLGRRGNGIDGAHILTPMPYLISAGKVTQNNVPMPMYILARLNLDGQCISVAQGICGLKVGLDAKPLQGGARKEEGRRQGHQGRHDLPGRHARPLDPLLAGSRRHRSRQGHRDHRGAAAADGGQHEGRHHGLLLRLRAVERAARPPEHRLHGDYHRRALEQAPGEGLRACAPPGSTRTRMPQRRC